jgi:hypothetical protein
MRIENVELVKQALGRWHPSDLAFIRSLELKSDAEGSVLELEFAASRQDLAEVLEGEEAPAVPQFRVAMRFTGVRDLQLKGTGANAPSPGFGISDVSDRGWEGVRYLVWDYETEQVRFYCGGIEVLHAEPLDAADSPVSEESLA